MPTQAIPADMAVSSKFAAFNIVDISYKVVNDTPIPASILIPKDVKPGYRPVIVRFHGGCFITGHRVYPEWFGTWILQLATSRQAIVITADYRLMPEANGLDILQDIRDLFNWLATPENLTSHLPEGVIPDIDHLLVTGESAGGWLALQSALLPTSREKISAVIAHYPMIDMRDPHYTGDYEKHLFTPTAPQLDRSILKNYLADKKEGDVVTAATPPDRVPLVISFMQQGAYKTHFGDDSILYPLEALENVDSLPPTWVFHGEADTVIPVEGTRKYEMLMKQKLPDAKVHFHYEKDADHGFDNDPSVTLETAWIREGLDFIGQHWPKC